MANPLIPRKSATPGIVPTASQLLTGEIATNLADGRLFVKKTDGTIAELSGSAGAASFDTTADFPANGKADLIYIATATAKTYIWNGSVYYEAGPDTNYVNTLGALYARRSDVVGYTSYTGKAVFGSVTSASAWTIRKTVYTSAGTVSSTTTATNVKWDDRLTATYS